MPFHRVGGGGGAFQWKTEFIYYSYDCHIKELSQGNIELKSYTVVITYPKMDRVNVVGDFGRITAYCDPDASFLVLLRVILLSNTSLMF